MLVAIGKVYAEYHDPVGIRKAMDSSTELDVAIILAVYNFFKDF